MDTSNSVMSIMQLSFEGATEEMPKESRDVTADENVAVIYSMTDTSSGNLSHQVDMAGDETTVQKQDANSAMSETADLTEGKKKGGCGKAKRRKKMMKDINAPKQPLTGYVRFIGERREKLREQNPSITFAEITKILGAEWTRLPVTDKQKYLDDAEKDKERYCREMEAYQKTEAYRLFQQQIQNRGKENDSSLDQSKAESFSEINMGDEDEITETFDIPIFTEEFLDHNKNRETELRNLRRRTTELEEQNAILGKHIDNMKVAIDKLEVEAIQTRSTNVALQQHLTTLRQSLTNSFSSIPLPGTNDLPTLDTIDSYMAKLHTVILDSPQENEGLIMAVREIIRRLNFDCEKT